MDDDEYNKWLKGWVDSLDTANSEMIRWAGVDWAAGSGMNRGEVISRNGNVTEIRFSTVT